MKVLIVDDNRLITYMVSKYVKNHFNAEVVVAQNGEKGLKTFKQSKFDLIITDCHMPILEGYEMVERIRSIDQEVKIIAFTIFEDEIHRGLMKKAGVDTYVVKDGDIKVLMQTIEELMPQ